MVCLGLLHIVDLWLIVRPKRTMIRPKLRFNLVRKQFFTKERSFPSSGTKFILPRSRWHGNTQWFSKQTRKRNISMFVAHWDVCLNAKTCFKVLNKNGRSASIHFAIDNDGTIYQFLDMNDIAWHASHRTVNRKSVGVEISNAYYPKYQNWYKKNGFGERPMVSLGLCSW